MSGMLTVVGNPRRRKRAGKKRRSTRRRVRRGRARAAIANPARRRRYGRRVGARRRRRYSNPRFGGQLGVNTFIKGVTGAGVGAIGARVLANAVKNQFFPTAGVGLKIAIEAGVGTVGAMLVGSVLKQRALAAGLAAGAAVVVALDIYDAFIKPSMPALLQDYGYGTLSDWAPQRLGAYGEGTLSDGGGVYDGGVYG